MADHTEGVKALTGQAVFPIQVKEQDIPCPVMASSAQSESALFLHLYFLVLP